MLIHPLFLYVEWLPGFGQPGLLPVPYQGLVLCTFDLRAGREVDVTWSTLCSRLLMLGLGLHGPREWLNLLLGSVGQHFRSLVTFI